MERGGEEEEEAEVLAGQLFREIAVGVGGDLHSGLQRESPSQASEGTQYQWVLRWGQTGKVELWACPCAQYLDEVTPFRTSPVCAS